MATHPKAGSLFDGPIVRRAAIDAVRKLDPRVQVRNPVMFVVLVGSILTTGLWLQALLGQGEAPAGFIFWISVWLWFTVLFANFAEAMAEGRGKAQAEALRRTRQDVQAKRLARPERGAAVTRVPGSSLRLNDAVLVEAGDVIPGDGEVIEGVASVDESAITGESAPVIRESGGDRSAVTGGTRVLSDWLIVRISANPGEAFLDRMIAMVEGAKRQKTPNEIALNILLAGFTIIFLLATATLLPYSLYSVAVDRTGYAGDRHGPGGPARVPDPHDDRRAPLRDRHRRHGPDAPGERDRDVGPRRRGCRRRRRAAPRQDRHDHARQPPGHRVPPGCWCRRARPRRRRPACLAGRRDPGGPQHRRAGQAEVRDPGAGRDAGWGRPSWRSPRRPG